MNDEKKISYLEKRNADLEISVQELKQENERLSSELKSRAAEVQEKIDQIASLAVSFNNSMIELRGVRERYEKLVRDFYELKKSYSNEIEKELKRIKREK